MQKLKVLQKTVVVVLIILSTVLYTSCQKEPLPVESNQDSNQFGLPKFALPEGATFESATFNIYVANVTNQDIFVHRITAQWEEMTVTWNNFGSSFDSNIEVSFNAAAVDWYSIDVTSLVGSWLNGTNPNYGLLLKQGDENYPRTSYRARTSASWASYLEICYTLNGEVLCDTTRAFEDAYVWQVNPNNNYGGDWWLYTGWADTNDLEKYTLVKFDLEYTSSAQGECTSVPLYWQWHTQYGPGSRDTNWDLIQSNGENSQFFLSGKSYYQVLMQPAWFNDYYSLARQYIAAKLNILRGAEVPAEVQTAFDNATNLLSTYTPAQVAGYYYWHPIRTQFRFNAFKLLKYNWGIIGPGRCYNCGM